MIWPVFAFIATLGAAAMPLLQQHFRPSSVAMLFWMRLFSLAALAPFTLALGMPQDIRFYIGTFLIAAWMSLTDILYFNGVKKHGAGVIARVLPASAIVTFFLWFAFDPALVFKYMDRPVHSMVVIGALFTAAYFASHLKKCDVSIAAMRDIWFVMLGAAIGPIAAKITLSYAAPDVAPLAFGMMQGVLLGGGYLAYQLIWRPETNTVFFGRYSVLVGALIAIASMVSIVGKAYAYQYVDNPAYVSMVLFTAPFMISLYERAMGHKDESNKWAGFGLVIAAAILVIFQIK